MRLTAQARINGWFVRWDRLRRLDTGSTVVPGRVLLLEAMAVVLLVVIVDQVMKLTGADLSTVRPFFDATNPNAPWPHQQTWIVRIFYNAAPYITGFFALQSLALVIGSYVGERRVALLRVGLFLFVSLVIGPGLIVNTSLKDHWGHPRPRDIVEFGGDRTYVAPPWLAACDCGKSFPCGHCSVGFMFSAYWLLFRRRRPFLAAGALVLGLVLGTLLGVARMTAGGHYLSDILWAAALVHLTCLAFYVVFFAPEENVDQSDAPIPAATR